jgi:hypothetical protein
MTDSEHNSHDDAPSYDDINTPVIVLVGVISAIVTLITIMFVQGLCYHWHNSFLRMRSKNAVVENAPAVVEINKQKEILKGGEGITPIDEAIKKVVGTYGK